MSINPYEDLAHHVGHEIKCVLSVGNPSPCGYTQAAYGDTVTIECMTCHTVLMSREKIDTDEG
jgi:hypothetical protein